MRNRRISRLPGIARRAARARLAAGFLTLLLMAVSLSVFLLATAVAAPAQKANQRLILKDGSYQVVTQYKIVGDRVRYLSAEREQWEELPKDLVDWPATEKWAKDHAPGARPPTGSATASGSAPASGSASTQANSEAAEIDREEQQERAEQISRTPEVAPGLLLPDRLGVWILDTYRDRPELVELIQDSGNINRRTGHNVLRGALEPSGDLKQPIQMDGAFSKISVHVDEPVLYVRLSGDESAAPSASALTVDTHGAGSLDEKDAYSSPASKYAIVSVRNNIKRNYRAVSPVSYSGGNSKLSQGDELIPTTAEILPGNHWMKLTPKESLTIGDYALVEILASSAVNLSVWDFRVDPQGPENANAVMPLNRTPEH